MEILARIQRERYQHHSKLGRTMLQKMAYFATHEGLPTGFSFGRSSYGPFSPNLKSAIIRMANNGVIEEQRVGSMFAVRSGPTYADAKRVFGRELQEWDPIIERTADLLMRMTTSQAEIAATVHFAAEDLRKRAPDMPSENDVLEDVRSWKARRRPPLDKHEVAETIRSLNLLGWIDVQLSQDLPVANDELLYA